MDGLSPHQPGAETELDYSLGDLSRRVLGVDDVGVQSSRPALMAYHDSTRTKSNSLSKSSQEIVALLDGKVKITTYTNLLDRDFWSTLPDHINFDKETFRPYTRFKPDMKIRYVYFYDNANNPELEEQYPDMSDEERAKQISENYGRVGLFAH